MQTAEMIFQEVQNPIWDRLVGRGVWIFDALLSTAILLKVNCTVTS
jgi:hypothetical protein